MQLALAVALKRLVMMRLPQQHILQRRPLEQGMGLEMGLPLSMRRLMTAHDDEGESTGTDVRQLNGGSRGGAGVLQQRLVAAAMLQPSSAAAAPAARALLHRLLQLRAAASLAF